MKVTVTYIIEFGDQKLTKTAEAEAEDGAPISEEVAASLWHAVHNARPKEAPPKP